jgi:hypothetical protein
MVQKLRNTYIIITLALLLLIEAARCYNAITAIIELS